MATCRLSVVVVVSGCRSRSQRALDALGGQTAKAALEIVVIDLAGPGTPRLRVPDGVTTIYREGDGSMLWSSARAEGLRTASSPVVAFIEDHCFPSSGWADALIRAHEGRWAAVGYAFTNANPQTYVSRAGMINDYGLWVHPVRPGPTTFLPGQNLSYKRECLLPFGDRLEALLTPDFNLLCELQRAGHQMCVEPAAIVAHEHFSTLGPLMSAHYAYCRLLAAKRARMQSWTASRRLFYAAAVLPGAPLLATARLCRSLRGRPELWRSAITALPLFIAAHAWAAIGESVGYLRGPGDAERKMHHWELEWDRNTP